MKELANSDLVSVEKNRLHWENWLKTGASWQGFGVSETLDGTVTQYQNTEVCHTYFVVECTNVQCCISGCILCTWLSAVEQQVFQVLGMSMLAGLVRGEAEIRNGRWG